MNKRLFVLRDNDIKREMVLYVANLPLEPLMQAEIKPFVKNRSLEQNSAYWAVYLPAIRQKVIDTSGKDYIIDAWHEWFKDLYAPSKFVDGPGGLKEIKKSTRKLNVKEWIAYINDIQQWCYDNLDGFHLPELLTKNYD